MKYDDVVLGRRSIRGFKREPVSKDVIRGVMALAMRAPSSLNTQPWKFYVVTGAPLDRIRAGNTERNLAGMPDSREFRAQGAYEGVHRERQIEIAKQLFAVMGIDRHDAEKRRDWVLRGFRQFDAPVSIVVTYDRSIHGGDIGPFDCGRDQRTGERPLVARAWLRDQQPRHHAIARRSRTCRHTARSSDHDLRGDGLSRRYVSRQCRRVATQGRG
jgi:hypothetical protein